jgi:hypothetical protein
LLVFKPDPVPDDMLERFFNAIVVRDPARKKQLAEWYLPYWNKILEMAARGEYRGATIALGSAALPRKLSRGPVSAIVFSDRYGSRSSRGSSSTF